MGGIRKQEQTRKSWHPRHEHSSTEVQRERKEQGRWGDEKLYKRVSSERLAVTCRRQRLKRAAARPGAAVNKPRQRLHVWRRLRSKSGTKSVALCSHTAPLLSVTVGGSFLDARQVTPIVRGTWQLGVRTQRTPKSTQYRKAQEAIRTTRKRRKRAAMSFMCRSVAVPNLVAPASSS